MSAARGKKSVVINLKDPAGIETLLRMVENADVLIDPFRPGVCEKLGIGPDVCLARNPKLVFARMTGWGQDGPLAQSAGHDINYISITGALYAMGRKGQKPVPPLNLVGDMGGGGMLLVNGVLAALLETREFRQGPGDRCGHGGWRRATDVDVPQFPGHRPVGCHAARVQYAGRRRAFLRYL